MHAFVLLRRDLDVEEWKTSYNKGLAPDLTPYGYHHAQAMNCAVKFSNSTVQTGAIKFLDRVLRKILGFDLVHAWKNYDNIFNPDVDVIWTHTEHEHLAIRALELLTLGTKRAAPMISQTIWLMDYWDGLSWLKKALYRYLLKNSDVLTVHSPINKKFAIQKKLAKRVELVLFGISPESFPVAQPRLRFCDENKVRVLSLGNDKHRDWETLAAALGDLDHVDVLIGSKTFPKALLKNNFRATPMTQADIRAAYDWADCVILPLKENMHVSGLTVTLESVALGIPVIVAKTGGIEEYFDADCIHFFKCGDPESLKNKVLSLPGLDTLSMAKNAQERLISSDLSSKGFAKRHVSLSENLIQERSKEKKPVAVTAGSEYRL